MENCFCKKTSNNPKIIILKNTNTMNTNIKCPKVWQAARLMNINQVLCVHLNWFAEINLDSDRWALANRIITSPLFPPTADGTSRKRLLHCFKDAKGWNIEQFLRILLFWQLKKKRKKGIPFTCRMLILRCM